MNALRALTLRARASSPLARFGLWIAGWTLAILGLVMIVLPGPGLPLVLGGAALLAREHRWARRLFVRLRAWLAARARRARGGAGAAIRP